MMLTTDLSLKMDPIYAPIAKRFYENPDQLADAFAKAWFKLLHRDMGPRARYLGPVGPGAAALAGPRPAGRSRADRRAGHRGPQAQDPRLGPVHPGARFHGLERGGQLPRHRQARRRQRSADPPCSAEGLGGQRADPAGKVLKTLEQIQKDFNSSQSGGKKVSLADLIVLGGCAAVEQAARKAGHDVTVPFAPGRTDASQEQTDVNTFDVLEPIGDGFRNYLRAEDPLSPETRLLDRANLLKLTAPEMTVLVGGMRVLNANHGQSKHGVFTDRPGTLTNDFFVNLLDMGTAWRPSASAENVYEGSDRTTGKAKWTATAADLVFGAHSQLRALAEVYASDDAKEKFVRDFVAAWNKVMNLDRYDLLAKARSGRRRAAA